MSEIDLDNPKDARTFLRGVRFEGKAIDRVKTVSGAELMIDLMTDDQAVFYAKEVYFDFCGGKEGERGTIDLETENQNQ